MTYAELNFLNRTVWSFNWVYLQNVFTNHIYVYVKTGFGIKLPTMVDMP